MSKENIVYDNTTNQFICRDTGFRLNGEIEIKPKDMKVSIWGYELCNGAEWKDFLDVVNKLGKEKTDLEAKLAESEESTLFWKKQYDCSQKALAERIERVNEVLIKLAEKEQEYKELKNKLHTAEQETLHFQNKYFAEKQIAIEELEKVKETTECVLDNALKNSSINQSYYDRLLCEINNQIKQLKEMK